MLPLFLKTSDARFEQPIFPRRTATIRAEAVSFVTRIRITEIIFYNIYPFHT